MHSLKLLAVFILSLAALAAAVPTPGGWKSHNEHYVIHVPYKVKHIHHHYVKKVPVYIKSSGWSPSSSGWYGGSGWSGSSGWSGNSGWSSGWD